MLRFTLLPGWILLAGTLATPVAAADDSAQRWFSVPLEVSGLPPNAAFVPVSCPLDFTALLAKLKTSGAVDERALRLYRVQPDGGQVEEPVQFTADPQPRGKARQLLPGTTTPVSYTIEYPAAETPDVRVAGTLTWIAQAGPDGGARYRLKFGVPRAGSLVQVPFPPQNLRAFDGQGRATPVRYFPQLQIRPQWPLDGVVHLTDQQQLVTSYHLGPTLEQAQAGVIPIRRPFLYPVNGPDGVSLTEFGKPHDPTGSHAHHYSLWIAHANVAGQDFWSEKGGVIAHEQLELQEDGPIFCQLRQRTRWIRNGVVYLREQRWLTLYKAARDFRLLDLMLEFSPGDTEAVELGQTTFGFVAVRVAQSMTPFDGGGEIRNANGELNEQTVHLRRAAWLDQSGPIAASPAEASPAGPAPARWNGIAVLDHPSNLNHPTTWHCRNDGWAGASVTARGPLTIRPADKLHLRYRLHLHRGDAVAGQVAERFAEYRAQLALRVGEPVAAE